MISIIVGEFGFGKKNVWIIVCQYLGEMMVEWFVEGLFVWLMC